MIQTTQSVLQPPALVQGMTVLDRSKFAKQISVPVLKVQMSMMHGIMSIISRYLLKMEKIKPIQNGDTDDQKIIYLNPDLVEDFNSFAGDAKRCLEEMGVFSKDLDVRSILLDYNNWKAYDIISAILPPNLKFSGYSIIGGIVHLNLREELSPFKKVIGDVLRDKIAPCKSVVNKVGIIDNVYRNFQIEILSGSDDLKTVAKENGCKFEMDFSEVYWNSRLHEEHCRIINLISGGDVLYDVFCGVGPFALPVAKKGCYVLANDLNPACYRWLNHNIKINKVSQKISTFQKSGEDFIKEDFKKDYLNRIADDKYKNSKFHITMNLPSTAYTFLSAFINLFASNELMGVQEDSLPIVYLYCFLKNKTETLVEVRKLLTEVLPSSIANKIDDRSIFHVRNVAPNKEMFRVTFSLSKDVLSGAPLNKHEHDSGDDGFCAKKIRLSSVDAGNLKRANSTEENVNKKFKSD